MDKKVILITGSTDGIGKLCAIKLAKQGHIVYVHGRNSEKLENVVLEIRKVSSNENVEGFLADFSDLDDVKKMSKKVLSKLERLDVLINNAGIFKSSSEKNKNGFDMRIVVNYFAVFLLTYNLMALFEKSLSPRILNLGSAAQKRVEEEVLRGDKSIMEFDSYSQSKLAITMWSYYLSKQYENICTIAVNPGSLLNTNMVKKAFGDHRAEASKGADILYNLAILDEFEFRTGEYFDNDLGDFGAVHDDFYDEEKIEELIRITEDILSKI